ALAELAGRTGATEVYCSADSGPFARARAARGREELAAAGAALRAKPGLHAVDDLGRLRTAAGDPYRVFSPFHRAWAQGPRREVLPAPAALPPLPADVRSGCVPSLAALGLETDVDQPPRGGEGPGRLRL